MTAGATGAPVLGQVVGLFADVHGAHETLGRALALCRQAGVETVALLGDLVDRAEQADRCALALAGWAVVGVYGNHERELVAQVGAGQLALRADTLRLLSALREEVVSEEVCLLHEAAAGWGHGHGHREYDLMARLFNREGGGRAAPVARVTFAGHTHYRHARDDRGPLDLGRGALVLDPARRYLINPGALVAGQFAVWDRAARTVYFRQVGG